MPPHSKKPLLLLAAALAALLPPRARSAMIIPLIPPPYDEQFFGDATYYGVTPDGDGNCAIRSPLPEMYDGMIPVALNDEQYADSHMCGACIEGEGSGEGEGGDPVEGAFKAYVTDRCPECLFGDLDFAADGDGRWDISWHFVPCEGSADQTFLFEGSNEFYWKIQPRGGRSPVERLWINGDEAERSEDNFFILEGGPFDGEQEVHTKTVLNKRRRQSVAME
ncbi:unnamed protein product [Ectocarpus sp. 13 AM-2016]